jgi:DNA polymerase III catalytic subunit, PolC type
MTKMFFDVFPTLEVNGDMKKLLSETEVTKVGMNHEKDHIRIYLNGTRLIHKKNIYQLEKTYMIRFLKTGIWTLKSLKIPVVRAVYSRKTDGSV